MDILILLMVVAGATLMIFAGLAWFTRSLGLALIGATIVALIFGLNFTALRDGFRGIIPPPTAIAAAPSPTATVTPTPTSTPVPAATPVPATPVPSAPAPPPANTVIPTGSGSSCSDNGVTALSPRESLTVNGVQTSVQVRDPNCRRALFHTETGVNQGANYKLVIPKGWSLGVSAVSCQVAQDSKAPIDYKNGPFLVIRGPWSGSIGCFEAGLHGIPSEWEQDVLIGQILPIHRSETKKPTDQPIILP